MSIFNIKLKTKAGNDVRKKVTYTTMFRVMYKKNVLNKKVTALYTYRIMCSDGQVIDPACVLELKNADKIKSIEDLQLKVILNICHIIAKSTKAREVDPDFILFISPDLSSQVSKLWTVLKLVFNKDVRENKFNKAAKVNDEETKLLSEFVDNNVNTKFLSFDPNVNKEKYYKSIKICNLLQERIDDYNKKQLSLDVK